LQVVEARNKAKTIWTLIDSQFNPKCIFISIASHDSFETGATGTVFSIFSN
jgi:hypothetical protein